MKRTVGWICVLVIILFILLMETPLFDQFPAMLSLREKITALIPTEADPEPVPEPLISKQGEITHFTGQNFQDLPQLTLFKVATVYVIDGDTIIFNLNGHEVRSRLLGIDTPESKIPDQEVQPFALEATAFVEKFLASSSDVYLALETGPPLDKYERLLVYVFNQEIVLLQSELLRQGFARSLDYWQQPLIYRDFFQELEATAKKTELNIWGLPDFVTDEGFNPIQTKKR